MKFRIILNKERSFQGLPHPCCIILQIKLCCVILQREMELYYITTDLFCILIQPDLCCTLRQLFLVVFQDNIFFVLYDNKNKLYFITTDEPSTLLGCTILQQVFFPHSLFLSVVLYDNNPIHNPPPSQISISVRSQLARVCRKIGRAHV